MRRVVFTVLAVLMGVVLFFGTAELVLRVSPMTPPVQIVRLDGADRVRTGPMGVPMDGRGQELVAMHIEVTDDGVPLFYPGYVAKRWRLGCAPGEEALRFVGVGSSILAGNVSQYDDGGDGIWSEILQRSLSEEGPACVSNLAGAGFTFDNQLALAKRHLPELAPQVVYWEMWSNSPQRWEVHGDRAYRFMSLARTPGEPPNPVGIPAGVHRWLFTRSRAWEAISLGLAERRGAARDEQWPGFVEGRLPEAKRLVESLGAELVLVFAPRLHRPLADQIAERVADPKRDTYRHVDAWAKAQGVDTIRLDELLQEHPVEDIRLDVCCHYNSLGQALLAEIFRTDFEARVQPEGAVEDGDLAVPSFK